MCHFANDTSVLLDKWHVRCYNATKATIDRKTWSRKTVYTKNKRRYNLEEIQVVAAYFFYPDQEVRTCENERK